MPTRLHRLSGADRWALALLVALPLAVFALPALFGHMAVIGDDATQNYPLRELVANLIRHGHLPLFDPYVWSGAPLLGGWNAGAAYPFILFFVVLPGMVAWTLTLVVTWWVAGIGSFLFLRASRLASVPSFLGALSFSFAGAMTAQVSHIGLVEGMSWAPVALLALLKLSGQWGDAMRPTEVRGPGHRSRLGWTTLLAVAMTMVILAGEPRAVTDVAVIVAIYGGWRALRLGRCAGPYLLWATGGVLLAVALGAVQWLPGMAAMSTSQRATNSTSLFASGSLPSKWLLLMFVPDLLGGSGSLGQPAFLAQYNLSEVIGYVGLMPLVASFALLGRLRLRRPVPEWLVWHLMALVGIVLALGGNTPLWHLLIRVPLLGSQRFQSRNVVIADMGFAFLLAYWSDAWLTDGRARRRSRAEMARAEGPSSSGTSSTRPPSAVGARSDYARGARVLGAVPGALAVATVAVGLAWGPGLLRWLDVSLRLPSADSRLRLWFLPFGVLGLAAMALVLWGHRLRPRQRTRALLGLVVVDVATFTLLAVATVLPNLGQASGGSTAQTASSVTRRPASIGAKAIVGKALVATPVPVAVTAAATLTGSGRFAVYDPNAIDANQLNEIEAPDLNVLDGVASVEGYGSIVDGTYAAATGTHSPTGDRGDILDPRAVGDGTLDQLDTTVLFAPRDYFLVSTHSDPAPPDPAAGVRRLAVGASATWYLGEDMALAAVVVPDPNAKADVESGLRFELVTPGGATYWAPRPTPEGAHLVDVTFRYPVEAVALVTSAAPLRASIGSPLITTADGTHYVADGQLEGAVVPPRWAFRGVDGSFAVFADQFARPALTILGSPRAWVRATAGPSFAPSAAAVYSPDGAEVIRSEAAIPGWTATWRPKVGPAATLSVRRDGLVQAVTVPPGHGVLTWSYDSPGWTAGWQISACALAILLALLLWPLATRRGPWKRHPATARQ
ncbi:MAG: hypothetical protein ABSD85_16115 [Acidimicrobiales bacterium]